MDCFPAVSSLKIFTSSISFRLACRTTISSCSFFNTLAFGWGLEMERTLESNVFPEMFEEQDIRCVGGRVARWWLFSGLQDILIYPQVQVNSPLYHIFIQVSRIGDVPQSGWIMAKYVKNLRERVVAGEHSRKRQVSRQNYPSKNVSRNAIHFKYTQPALFSRWKSQNCDN